MPRPRIKDTVKVLLENHPILREDANYLISHIWRYQARELNISASEDIFRAMCDKSIWNAESFRRSRRKVIEQNPHLKPTERTAEQNIVLEQIMRQNRGEI